MRVRSTVLVLAMAAGTAQAGPCTVLQFTDSAPTDLFELTVGDTPLLSVSVDLGGSAGRLIFDTQGGGTGVSVFQPLRDAGGTLGGTVADGAQALSVRLRDGAPGTAAAFSIDVDDRLTASERGQTRVTGGEMQGAVAIFETAGGALIRAVFDADNRAEACGPQPTS